HVEQRGGARLAAAASDRAQEQHWPAAERRTDPPIADLVEPLVHSQERTEDPFDQWVHVAHPRRGGCETQSRDSKKLIAGRTARAAQDVSRASICRPASSRSE